MNWRRKLDNVYITDFSSEWMYGLLVRLKFYVGLVLNRKNYLSVEQFSAQYSCHYHKLNTDKSMEFSE